MVFKIKIPILIRFRKVCDNSNKALAYLQRLFELCKCYITRCCTIVLFTRDHYFIAVNMSQKTLIVHSTSFKLIMFHGICFRLFYRLLYLICIIYFFNNTGGYESPNNLAAFKHQNQSFINMYLIRYF